MDLIEDYLRAIALLLPEHQRDDIMAELRDVVLTRTEAREAELGRPLTEPETETVLREIGHPLVVAARYRGGPQHVVGPTLYPYWAFAVRVAVTIQCALSAVVAVFRTLAGGDIGRAFGEALVSALSGAVTLVGIATLAVWIIERFGVRVAYLDRWRVRDLKGLRFVAWDRTLWGGDAWRRRWTAIKPAAPALWASASESVADRTGRALGGIVTGTVLILWWLDILPLVIVRDPSELRALGLDPGGLAAIDWPRLKAEVFWPVLAYGFAIVAQGALLLTRPDATRLYGLFDLAISAGVLSAAAWLWFASPLAGLIHVDSAAQLDLRLEHAFGHGAPVDPIPLVTLAVVVTVFGGILRALRGGWAVVRPSFGRASPGVAIPQ